MHIWLHMWTVDIVTASGRETLANALNMHVVSVLTGTTKQLLEENNHAFGQISANISNLKVNVSVLKIVWMILHMSCWASENNPERKGRQHFSSIFFFFLILWGLQCRMHVFPCAGGRALIVWTYSPPTLIVTPWIFGQFHHL